MTSTPERRFTVIAGAANNAVPPRNDGDKGITCAVLPFQAAPEDEPLANLIAEDVLAELARFQNVTVAGRAASFACRAYAADTPRVARELGIQFVIEGAMNRVGDERVRFTIRLLEGETGQVLASERFERRSDTLLAEQDELVRHITARIAPQLDLAAIRRAERLPATGLRVQDMALRARGRLLRGAEAEDAELIEAGVAEARRATELDPRYAEAWRVLAFGHCIQGERGAFGVSTEADYRAADDAAAQLRALEPSSYAAYAIGGHVAMRMGRHAEALESLRHAHALNPHAVLTLRWLAWEETNHGLGQAAREHATLSLQLSPRDQLAYLGHWSLALAHWSLGDLEPATEHVRRAVALTPRFGGYYMLLAACLAEQDKLEEAAEAVARVRQNCPGLIESRLAGKSYFIRPELARRYHAALVRANAGAPAPAVTLVQKSAFPSALAELSERELEVLRLVAQGLSNAAVGRKLGISEHTAKRHIANILLKLDLPTRSAASTLAGRHGLI